jgi:polysaccharide biosynthesis transport protein
MPNLDFKFYAAVFLRRLPYFLVIAVFLSVIGVTVASILPPVYRSSASMLVEQQQISGELAQSTVPVNPYEQAQIIAQRLMTRTNLLALADRIGYYDESMSAGAIVGDIRNRIEFIGFEPDPTRARGMPGVIIIGVAFEAEDPAFALKGANELVNLVLQENVRLRTDRATDTLDFFDGEVARLSEAIERQAERIAAFKTANVDALPDSLAARRAQQQREQERLLALEREESALRNQRATALWVFERTGRAAAVGRLSPEEEELQTLRSQLIQQRAVYAPTSPRIRTLETRIAALEGLVEEQRASRALPGEDGEAAEPLSELDLELAPIDARLEFIAQDKAAIQETLAELDVSIQATPNNEMVLSGLERELETMQRQYNEASARLGQARVGERIEITSRGERFTLIEPPTEPGRPVRPKRVLIAGAGVVGGIGLGLGFVLLLEILNRSIRRPADISNGLGIQPFATIPYIRTRRESRFKTGVFGTVLGLVLIAIPVGLLALHTYYLPLDLLWSQLLGALGIG